MTFRDDLDEQRARAARATSQAGRDWADAMRSHILAPPDHGFAERLASLGEAAAREQRAWADAHDVGLLWRPVPGAENLEPPYELRKGTGRRGPADLWARFDVGVTRLNRAIAGSDAADVADAFGEVAGAAGELAQAVAQQEDEHRHARSDSGAAAPGPRRRRRGAA